MRYVTLGESNSTLTLVQPHHPLVPWFLAVFNSGDGTRCLEFMATSSPCQAYHVHIALCSSNKVNLWQDLEWIWRETVSLPGALPFRYPKMCFVYILIYFRHWRGPTLSHTCQLKHPTSGGNSKARLDHRSMYHEDHEVTSYLKSKAAPKIWPDKIFVNILWVTGPRFRVITELSLIISLRKALAWNRMESSRPRIVARWLRVSAPLHDEGQGQCPKRVAILVHEEGRHRLA